jgi:hypothetical protein
MDVAGCRRQETGGSIPSPASRLFITYLQRCLKERPFAPIEAVGFIAPSKTQRNEDCFACIAFCANAGSSHRIWGLN